MIRECEKASALSIRHNGETEVLTVGRIRRSHKNTQTAINLPTRQLHLSLSGWKGWQAIQSMQLTKRSRQERGAPENPPIFALNNVLQCQLKKKIFTSHFFLFFFFLSSAWFFHVSDLEGLIRFIQHVVVKRRSIKREKKRGQAKTLEVGAPLES